MLEELKKSVLEANLELTRRGLVMYTWGNASAIDRERGLVVIKPSGVDYSVMKADDMVIVDMEGNVVEGNLRPSSDTPTHIELYKAFENIGGVVHTHSTWAVAWAQARTAIPCYGTTHADYFYGEVPCTRALTAKETKEAYERNTGLVIIEAFREINPDYVPGVICANHGPFTWGRDAMEAVYHAAVLEETAKMAALTRMINPSAVSAPTYVLGKHFMRKHGKNAYYGQK